MSSWLQNAEDEGVPAAFEVSGRFLLHAWVKSAMLPSSDRYHYKQLHFTSDLLCKYHNGYVK